MVWGHRPNDWRGVKIHMGYNQEAYPTECAALVSALNLAADRQQRKKLERLTICTDAQAVITRMQSCEFPAVRPTSSQGPGKDQVSG